MPSKPATPEWPEHKVEALRKLAAKGWSAKQIAQEIYTTRNSVVGKAARMGVQLKGGRVDLPSIKPTSGRGLHQNIKAAKVRRQKEAASSSVKSLDVVKSAPLPRDVSITPRHVTRAELTRFSCEWITTDRVDAVNVRFCGDDRVIPAPHPYCAGHLKASAAPSSGRRL